MRGHGWSGQRTSAARAPLMADLDRVRRWAERPHRAPPRPGGVVVRLRQREDPGRAVQLHGQADHRLALPRRRGTTTTRSTRSCCTRSRTRWPGRGQGTVRAGGPSRSDLGYEGKRLHGGAIADDLAPWVGHLPEGPHALPVPQARPRAGVRRVLAAVRRGQPDQLAAPRGDDGAAAHGRVGRERDRGLSSAASAWRSGACAHVLNCCTGSNVCSSSEGVHRLGRARRETCRSAVA